MSNRVTLEQLDKMSEKEAAGIHISQLALLLEDVAELKATYTRLNDKVFQVLNSKYSGKAAELRRLKGTDTGTVRVDDDDFMVIADLPKSVAWDQARLAKLEIYLKGRVKDISEYIKIKREVEERKFAGWPSDLAEMFIPARTVKVGKQTFKVETRKEG